MHTLGVREGEEAGLLCAQRGLKKGDGRSAGLPVRLELVPGDGVLVLEHPDFGLEALDGRGKGGDVLLKVRRWHFLLGWNVPA